MLDHSPQFCTGAKIKQLYSPLPIHLYHVVRTHRNSRTVCDVQPTLSTLKIKCSKIDKRSAYQAVYLFGVEL
jgi:hypothetical protein